MPSSHWSVFILTNYLVYWYMRRIFYLQPCCPYILLKLLILTNNLSADWILVTSVSVTSSIHWMVAGESSEGDDAFTVITFDDGEIILHSRATLKAVSMLSPSIKKNNHDNILVTISYQRSNSSHSPLPPPSTPTPWMSDYDDTLCKEWCQILQLTI